MKLSVNSICPCGSLKKYKKCCKIFHDDLKKPSNALELMKSRFSAFAFCKSDYIIKTTHQKNCDFSLNTSSWIADIEQFCKNTSFENLEILDFIDSVIESFVTFEGSVVKTKKGSSVRGKSRVLKESHLWFYVDGEFLNS